VRISGPKGDLQDQEEVAEENVFYQCRLTRRHWLIKEG
jgi:uncharacterized protein affecting Mg2+/Co2+ transport